MPGTQQCGVIGQYVTDFGMFEFRIFIDDVCNECGPQVDSEKV